MRRSFALSLIAAALASAAYAAPAPEPPGEAAGALLGTREFTNAARDRTCTVTFHEATAPAGRRIAFEPACTALFPFLGEVAGWRLADNDFLRLLTRSGETVLEFSEVESGVYEAPRAGEGILFIQSPGAGGPAPRTAELAAGEYAAVRQGKPSCVLVLSPAQPDAEGLVELEPPCGDPLRTFAPARWLVEDGELVLVNADGESLRFQEHGDTDWRGRPPAGGLSLVRR